MKSDGEGGKMRERIYFSGRVQGVGFRYTCRQIAHGYEVAGWVRNLVDGRVEMEVEGAAQEVEAYTAAVQYQMGDYIRQVERHPVIGGAPLRDFVIR